MPCFLIKASNQPWMADRPSPTTSGGTEAPSGGVDQPQAQHALEALSGQRTEGPLAGWWFHLQPL